MKIRSILNVRRDKLVDVDDEQKLINKSSVYYYDDWQNILLTYINTLWLHGQK